MPRAAFPLEHPTLVAPILAWAVACGAGESAGLPRLASLEGVDPFVRERIEAALSACERDEPGARLELAKVYDANGLGELALAAYETCRGEKGVAPATLEYLRGVTLETLGRPEQALASFDAALRLGDAYAPTHWHRGELLSEAGRTAEARAAFEAALALEPQSIPAHLGLARLDLAGGDAPAVVARLEPLAERVPDERFVHGLLARARRAQGDEAGAERELQREARAQRVSLSDPRAAEVRTRATGVLAGLQEANERLAAGDAAAALALVEPLYERLPQDLAVLQMLGKALVEARDFARAVPVLEAGAARHPDEFKLELFLGLAFQGQKAHKKAREHLERARELNPAYGPTLAALGEVETKLARFAEAEATLARALECGEDALRTRLLLVQVQLEQHAFERALATAEATHEAFPNAAAAWSYLAEARARRGELEAARAALAEAERRNPEYERLALVRALLAPAPEPPR